MPRKKNTDIECPIQIVDEEERQRYMKTTDRSEFLGRLESVVNDKAFSVKKPRKNESNYKNKKKKEETSLDPDDMDFYTKDDKVFVDDDQWANMLGLFDELDPMDDIISTEKYYYKRGRNKKSPFEEKFSKEYSMVHTLLGDIQKHSKLVSKQLEAMGIGKKGASGIGKYTVDLINASASLHNSQLQAVKELVNIRKTITDLELKDLKNNPKEEETTDTSASRFYDHIINGGRNNFINAASGMVGGDTMQQDTQEPDDNSSVSRTGFNITQPISTQYESYDDEEVDDGFDPYNYISSENRDVSVCIQRFSDGDFTFVALDQDGEEVIGYELPDSNVLKTIKFSPTSNIATDMFGRKYRIIDIDTDMESY